MNRERGGDLSAVFKDAIILTADKPEDIDKWPPFALLFADCDQRLLEFRRYDGSLDNVDVEPR